MGTSSSGSGGVGAIMAAVFFITGARVALVWERLPPVVASHFGAAGQPNGWMPKGAFFGLLAAIGFGLPVLFLFAGRWMKFIPTKLINMPNRDYWLTPERKTDALRLMGSFMAWYGLVLSVFMAFVLELTIRANLNRAPLNSLAMMLGLGALFVVSIVMVVRLHRQLEVP